MQMKPWQLEVFHQIREMLYHPATGLIYDYISSFEAEERFAHLPSVEEVTRSFPNPCGWGTGMEDCAINTGTMLSWWAASGLEHDEFVESLAAGLCSLGSVHGKRGFIVRGLLPDDGKSCYPNSSRDQFTIAVYGMWRYLQRNPDYAPGIRFLCDVADYCERTVTPENGYSLLRLDGGPAIVSSMWNCAPHEVLRLPMFYGAAWAVSGEQRYRDLMNRYLEEGLRETLKTTPAYHPWWDMPLVQMQCSLRFFEDSNLCPEQREQVRQGLRLAGGFAEEGLQKVLTELEAYPDSLNVLFNNWRLRPMSLTKETLSPDGRSAIFGGLTYLNPSYQKPYATPNYFTRSIGNALAMMAMAPELPPSAQALLGRVDQRLSNVDFRHFAGAGIVPLLYGSSLLAQKTASGKT